MTRNQGRCPLNIVVEPHPSISQRSALLQYVLSKLKLVNLVNDMNVKTLKGLLSLLFHITYKKGMGAEFTGSYLNLCS